MMSKAQKFQWPTVLSGLQGVTLANLPREISAGITLAAMLIGFAPIGDPLCVQYALALALLCGLLFFLFRLFRLAFLANFLSRAVLAFIRPHKNVIDYELLPYHRFGLGKYEMLGEMYELDDYKTPSDEVLQRLQWVNTAGGEVNR